MGRPSSFTQEVADTICTRLMEGDSLRSICEDEDMPYQSVVYRWLQQIASFQEQYVRAREVQADTFADQIITLSDRSRIGIKTTIKADGSSETVEGDMVERTRLQIDARKWLASKMAPKKYGEKIQQEHTGPEGGAIQVFTQNAGELLKKIRGE